MCKTLLQTASIEESKHKGGKMLSIHKHMANLKEQSKMTRTTCLYDMHQKILTKKVISKISVDSNFTFTHSYVHWHCSIDYCVFALVDETFKWNCFYFTLKWFLVNSFEEMRFLEESYKKMQKIQILTFLWALSVWNLGVYFNFAF